MAENIQDDTYVRNLRVEVYPILPFESNNNNLKTSVIYDGTIEKNIMCSYGMKFMNQNLRYQHGNY